MKGGIIIVAIVVVIVVWFACQSGSKAPPAPPAVDAKQEEERKIEELAAQRRKELAETARLKQEAFARVEREQKEKELKEKEAALKEKELALLKAKQELEKKSQQVGQMLPRPAVADATKPNKPLEDVEVECPLCKGKKLIACDDCDGKGKKMMRVQCPNCSGVIKNCTNCPTPLPPPSEYPWARNYARVPGTCFCFDCRGTGGATSQKIGPFSTTTRCARCGGLGWYDCPKCKDGIVICTRCENKLTIMKEDNCQNCRGKGKVKCSKCEGEGKILVKR